MPRVLKALAPLASFASAALISLCTLSTAFAGDFDSLKNGLTSLAFPGAIKPLSGTVVNKISDGKMYFDSWKDNTIKVTQGLIGNSISAAASQAQRGITIIQKGNIGAAPGWASGTATGTAAWAANGVSTMMEYQGDTQKRVIECVSDTFTTNRVNSVMQRSGLTGSAMKRQVYDIMHDKVGYNVGEVFHDDKTLRQVIGNHMARADDLRPVAVYIAPAYASTDEGFLPSDLHPKGVVEEDVTSNLAHGYNVKYYSVDSGRKLLTSLADGLKGQGNKPGIVTIAAHGTPDSVQLQTSLFFQGSVSAFKIADSVVSVPFETTTNIEMVSGLPVRSNFITQSAAGLVLAGFQTAGDAALTIDKTISPQTYLSVRDEAMVNELKRDIAMDKKSVTFMSCLVGNGGEDNNNLVNMFARQFPGAKHVFGATDSISYSYNDYKPQGGLDNTRYYSVMPIGYINSNPVIDTIPVQSYDGITRTTY